MRRIDCVPAALLFLACVLPSIAQETTEVAPDTSVGVQDGAVPVGFEVGRVLVLNCSGIGGEADTREWLVNTTSYDKLPENLKKRFALSAGGSILTVSKTQESDLGTYKCSSGRSQLVWGVTGITRAQINDNYNVVEGQKFKVVCKLIGKPYPDVQWLYSRESDNMTANNSIVLESNDRIKLRPSADQEVKNAELVIEAAVKEDEGWYQCRPATGHADTMRLRVKDMYAALWPFLGICAEVFILCAIILVYEKRRTKPELDDSDTDNHDQKKS